ncbi:E3 ubiquitin-protein ligase siah-1-like isoform X3 [Pectinophora gossypiella]|uniref:E3 ubiquitin-protein ligase siah-1-like isoform X3 n=1 Tax=Pectinophora gossypiella TaxID=13191 RepID=UPI00214EB3EA|nr:E3 ubiquitin-protein ligase siah-1-like isoform X3 [Pectinophora gossypiella]
MSSTSSPTGKKILNTLLETDHYSGLIKELTCTKCNKYMKPPIHLCVDGHSICGICYEKSYQCHVCQKEFALIRSVVLESLANKVLFPCTNDGCPKHATLPILEKHTAHCQYRIINCFMARVYGECKWEGRAGEWMDHCFTDHKTRVTELPFITVKDKWDAKRTEPVLNYFLLRCFDKVFNVYQIYDKRGGRMMWTVLVNDEHAERFYFEVDLFLPNSPSKRIVYRRPCKCEKDADFLEHTQNVYIPVENVFSMLDETESMNFTVRIGTDGSVPASPLLSSTTSINVLENVTVQQLKETSKSPEPNRTDTLPKRASRLWSSARNSWPGKKIPAFDGIYIMMYPGGRKASLKREERKL